MTLPATERSVAAARSAAGCDWRAVLPPQRRYVAIPTPRRPFLVAERDRAVLEYVRRALLSGPPRARMPAWLFAGARSVLAVPAAWRALPSLRVGTAADDGCAAPRDAAAGAMARWLRDGGHRLLVLDHSHDPDRRFVVLAFEREAAEPATVLKVAATPAAVARVHAERDLMRRLALHRLDVLRDSVPRLVAVPAGVAQVALASTAASGTSMLVRYHRPGHTARPDDVRTDFHAAAAWLRTLRDATADGPARLGVPETTFTAARRQLADAPALAAAVARGLHAVDSALRGRRAVQTLVHGDFWAGNLLTRGAVVTGVVDWERAEPLGSPVRDLARFVLTYSYYLDRHVPRGRQVPGHRGLVADGAGAGLRYALDGAGWYPTLVRRVLGEGLDHAGIPRSDGREIVLAELANLTAEASEPGFARAGWALFARLTEA